MLVYVGLCFLCCCCPFSLYFLALLNEMNSNLLQLSCYCVVFIIVFVFFIRPWVISLLFSLFLYDCVSDLLFHHLFHVCKLNGLHFVVVFCNFFFCFGMLLFFGLWHSLIFLLVYWYFLSFSPTSCMIVFCCSFFIFSACCCFL